MNNKKKDRKKEKISNLIKNSLKLCKKFWVKMSKKEIKIIHSFYFKFFELNIEQYSKKINYDVIMLDEGQDSNNATLNIFNNLRGQKILVGDNHQSIYGFRGSNNIMESFKADKENFLSTSFRFNSGISKIANDILGKFKFENKKIESINKGMFISYSSVKTLDVIDIKTKGLITRTNAELIRQFNSKLNTNQYNINFIKNPKDIFGLTLSLINVKNKIEGQRYDFNKILEKWLLNFNEYDDIKFFAEEANDYNLLTSISLIEEGLNIDYLYGKAIEIHDKEILRDENKIDLFLTNAHTSKGLEWDEVEITDDFIEIPVLFNNNGIKSYAEYQVLKENKSPIIFNIEQEINLFYVAITRA
ncbi:MAG: UvrD-helicase domain-containing protein, partial [Candidatus Gracilibacteria bacterium]|nr:UvrD-helicase domain-containing protein [Candidatus Gracilibacteria bacterium]